MELQTALEKYRKLQAKLSAYGHAMALIYYDGATTAPSGTAANRGQTLSVLSEETYVLSTGKETVELLEFLDAHRDELDYAQARSVYLSLKDIREMQKIPMEEYVAYQRLINESEDVWHRAKAENDYAAFAPYIDKIVAANKRFAGYVKPEMDAYEYCLDSYEE